MKNLLLSLAVAAVAAVIGSVVGASWVAGLIPALLGGGLVYVLLARRSLKKLEAIAMTAGASAQAGDVAGARAALEKALELGKEQFLVAEQIHGQLGMLDYMEAMQPFVEAVAKGARPPSIGTVAAKIGTARAHFEKAWSRDWRAKALLAVVHQREARHAEALAVMEKTASVAQKEPIFWGIWAWLHHEGQEREAALQVIGKGLAANAQNAPLTALQEALSNQRRPDFTVFGDNWIQFFPDHVSREKLFEMLKASGKVPANAQMAPANSPPRNYRPVGPTPPPPRGGRFPRG